MHSPSPEDRARATAIEIMRRVDDISAKADSISKKIAKTQSAISKSEFLLITSRAELQSHMDKGHNLKADCIGLDAFDGYSLRYLRSLENIDSWFNRILFYCEYMNTGDNDSNESEQDHT